MTVEMTKRERDMLVGLVRREISELGPEIQHTRTARYRDDLKAEKQMLVGLLGRLAPAATP